MTSPSWALQKVTRSCWRTVSHRSLESMCASDDWGVDIAYSGTQKCLGVPPGLSPLSVAPRALERMLERPRSWYFDLQMIANYVTGSGARAYHHTAPISMIYALQCRSRRGSRRGS